MTLLDLPNNTHPSWWKDPGMRTSAFHLAVLYSAVYSLGYDGSLLNGLQALAPWNKDFGSPKGAKLGIIAASYYLPKIPSMFFMAWFADRFGRKALLFQGAFFMLAGAFVGAFAHSTGQFIGGRVLLGLGTVAAQIGATTMIPELTHPRLRHVAGGLLMNTFSIGSIFSSWLTFAMVYYPGGNSWAWRIPTIMQAFGPVLLGLGLIFVPESPRWLMKQGKADEAHRILAKYHANGTMDDALVLAEIQEMAAAIELEKVSSTSSWLSFFKTPSSRRRFGIIMLFGCTTQLAGNGVVQYYLVPILRSVGITKPAQTAGVNGGLSVFNWMIGIIGALLVNKLGRKPMILISLSGMLCSFIFIMGLSAGYDKNKVPEVGIATIPFIFIFMGFYTFGLTPVPMLYVPEITPLAMRAKAVGLLTLFQNTTASFNQFVNPIALAAIGWRYYGAYIGWLGILITLYYLFMRETKGLTVEEASVIYENADARTAAIEAERALADAVHQNTEENHRKEENEKLEEAELDEYASRDGGRRV